MADSSRIVPKKRVVSPVWDYFGLRVDDEGKVIDDGVTVCRRCNSNVRASGGNTSNLLSHLRTHHPSQYTQVLQAQKAKAKENDKSLNASSSSTSQVSIPELFTKGQKYERTTRRWREITDSVTYCISKDMFPIYTTEKVGFRRLVETLDPRYEMPSAKYFSNTAIPALFEKTRERVVAEVTSARYYSSTTDMWTSSTMEPYLSYSIHFIDSDWNLQSRCLQTLFVPKDHNANNLSEILKETLAQWKLEPGKQVCITTDNGSNIICATTVRLMWTHLPCFGHNLHLAVVNSTKDEHRVQRALGLCRKLVSTFSHSWKKKRDLTKAQSDLGLPQHSLVTDCATRWGSQLKMIDRVVEQEACIRQVLTVDRKYAHLIPTWQDLDVLESMKAALGQLDDFTDMLSGEQKVTVSAINPVLHILKTKVLKACEDDTDLTKTIKQRVLDNLLEKYDDADIEELLNVCTYLDPRFKGSYIDDEISISLVKDRLAREGVEMIEDQDRIPEPAGSAPTATDLSTDSEQSAQSGIKKRKLSSWLKEAVETHSSSSTPQTPEQMIKKEIEDYIKQPLLDAELNPLQWWKVHMVVLPTMAKLARKYLCVCASSSASERIFSCSGNIVSKKRTLLKPDKVNMLVFLAKNLQ